MTAATASRCAGAFAYPDEINDQSIEHGKARARLNAALHSAKPEMSRGSRGQELDILGIKAELIARWLARRWGWNFVAAPLVADRPVSEPDIIVEGLRIDVKGVNGRGLMNVNCRAHANAAKAVDVYWFIQPFDDNSCCWLMTSHSEVSHWQRRQHGIREPYFTRSMQKGRTCTR